MSRGRVVWDLPQEILCHIHSLLPLQDAARAACVSRGFLQFWRCYSKLVLNHRTLGLTDMQFVRREINFMDKVDQILENHHNNGVLVEILELEYPPSRSIKPCYLDRWLQITVKPGIKQLDLSMCVTGPEEENYNFPCSVLSNGAAASSIQSLCLSACSIHPTSTLGVLRKLTSLHLNLVHTTEEGLGNLLSKSFALERLDLWFCRGINCLRIPSMMQNLKFLEIIECQRLKVVEINASNLCFLHCVGGDNLREISARNSSQLKNVTLSSVLLSYAHAWLPSIARNAESLTLCCPTKNVNISSMPSNLLHLKKLDIELSRPTMAAFCTSYDVFSLLSFIDASPVLDSFILTVEKNALKDDLDMGDENNKYLGRKLERRHVCLRRVDIMGFCASKSLVELTIHILENAPSLENLILDTIYGYNRCLDTFHKCTTSTKIIQCSPLSRADLARARRAVKVAGRYIVGRVPSSVQLEILDPCNRCNTGEW
ncbi:uncharacterized protein [Triticum aestivum]|uniref:uncharacterized protein n=1 Tax=Triticum aestivum TaxID=4565 RepID=UPI001D02439B|nr:uncharacterized protein LOC123081063 [Triticum aestivum]